MRIAIKSRGTKNKTGFTHIRKTKRKLEFKMADLPSNEDILRDYFDSDDNDSDFEGFSEVESDISIPEESSSEEESEEESESEPENEDEWTDTLRASMLNDFTKRLGLCFLQISTFKQQPQRTISI